MRDKKNTEEIKNYYNNFLQYLIKDRIYPNKRHSYIKRIVKRYIKKGLNVIDLGCGIGITTEFIKKRGADVIGVDISPEIIKYARSSVPDVKFICEDILKIDFKGKFDFICLFDCLEHINKERYEKLFDTLKEHSKIGTKILMTIPNPLVIEKIRNTNPERLQIVDENIFFTDLIPILQKYGFMIRNMELFGIDYQDEYYFINLEFMPKIYKIQPLPRRNIFFRIFLKFLFPFRYISYMYKKMKYLNAV